MDKSEKFKVDTLESMGIPEGSKTLDLADIPTREWWRAMEFFNDGDPSVIAQLLIKGEAMPLHVRIFIADIVTGKRLPPKAGKARKLLNYDHKERLKAAAGLLRELRSELSKQVLDDLKNTLLRQVVTLSGALPSTVNQEFKKANSKWLLIDKNNRRFRLDRDRKKTIRALSLKNDPFGRSG